MYIKDMVSAHAHCPDTIGPTHPSGEQGRGRDSAASLWGIAGASLGGEGQ